MATCPQGHDSEWTDFCSVCGAPLAATPAEAAPGRAAARATTTGATTSSGAAAPATFGGRTGAGEGRGAVEAPCPHCGYPRDPADTFCESCGYDFATGQLPGGPVVSPAPAPTPPAPSAPAPAAPSAPGAARSAPLAEESSATGPPTPAGPTPPNAVDGGASSRTGPAPPTETTPPVGTWWAAVDVDRAYYDRVSAGGPVAFPADPPEPQSIPLLADTVMVGRRSRARGTSPEIDLSGPPEDPAVSHAHASLVRQRDGSYAVIDAGSTNGTRINDDDDPIPRNVPRLLAEGDRILLGAWSRITLERR